MRLNDTADAPFGVGTCIFARHDFRELQSTRNTRHSILAYLIWASRLGSDGVVTNGMLEWGVIEKFIRPESTCGHGLRSVKFVIRLPLSQLRSKSSFCLSGLGDDCCRKPK